MYSLQRMPDVLLSIQVENKEIFTRYKYRTYLLFFSTSWPDVDVLLSGLFSNINLIDNFLILKNFQGYRIDAIKLFLIVKYCWKTNTYFKRSIFLCVVLLLKKKSVNRRTKTYNTPLIYTFLSNFKVILSNIEDIKHLRDTCKP